MRARVVGFTVLLVWAMAALSYGQPDPQLELVLVENVYTAREAFRTELEKLVNFYAQSGSQARLARARTELTGLLALPRQGYLVAGAGPATPPGKAVRYIEEAEILFQDGIMYADHPDPVRKKANLTLAISRFERLLSLYPESERSDDACFMLAEIRQGMHFNDWQGALELYATALSYDPGTTYPVRLRAAEIYYRKLKDYETAAENFRWVAANDLDPASRQKAAQYLREMKATGRIKE
ncbi:MAG: hypothetical protein V2A58_05115 [Planctomycetota bacterium]